MLLRNSRFLAALCLPILCPVFAGCGDGAVPAARVTSGALVQRPGQTARLHPAWWREAPASVKRGVYVSQTNGGGTSTLFGFGAHNRDDRRPDCTIAEPNSVEDIGSDASGNVYVPSIAGESVTVYAPHCGSVIATFADKYGSPLGAVVRDNTIYLANENGNVAVCALGGCSSELTDPSIFQMTSAAVDPAGNVWAAYYDQRSAISLIVWRHASMPGHVVSGYVNNPVPGGILFDKHGGLISVAFGTAFTYGCSARRASCTSTGLKQLQGASNFAALNAANTSIQVTDFSNTSVDVFSYPDFTYSYSYDRGFDAGSSVQGITLTTLPN
jgi:hypothetical protein